MLEVRHLDALAVRNVRMSSVHRFFRMIRFCAFNSDLHSVFIIVYVTVAYARRYRILIRRFILDIKEFDLRICLVNCKAVLIIICSCISCKVSVVHIECIIRVCRECDARRMNIAAGAPSAYTRR